MVHDLGWTLAEVDALSLGDIYDYRIYKKAEKAYLEGLKK